MMTRRARLTVEYAGANITQNVEADLTSFTHNDNANGTADDISLTLKDNEGKWIGDWFSEKGDKVKITLIAEHWGGEGDTQTLALGTFIVDEPEYSLAPRQLTIKGVSIPNNTAFTDSPTSKGWNKVTLSGMIGEIAGKHGLALLYDAGLDPQIERVDQNEMSDMAFIAEQAAKYGLAYKISDEQIIIYSMMEYEQKPPVMTIDREGGAVLGGMLKEKPAYSGVKVVYTPPKTGKQVSHIFGSEDKLFTLNQSAANEAEAEQMAKGKLRELNQDAATASLSLLGSTKLVAGVVVALTGFGRFDGNYFVDKVTQRLPNFTLEIAAHKVLEGGY